jgi:hypothetical protein
MNPRVAQIAGSHGNRPLDNPAVLEQHGRNLHRPAANVPVKCFHVTGSWPTDQWCGAGATGFHPVTNAPVCPDHGGPAVRTVVETALSSRPVSGPPADGMMTDKQRAYIIRLLDQVPADVRGVALPWFIGRSLTRAAASDAIDRLKAHRGRHRIQPGTDC